MRKRLTGETRGISLLEVLMATSLFTVVLGMAADALVSNYAALHIQGQRVEAMQNCQSVLSAMRKERDTTTDTFPTALTDTWSNGWTTSADGAITLPEEVLTVTYVSATANPLEVIVTSQWSDLRGRTSQLTLSTILTDQ